MAATRGPRLQVGSAAWIAEERSSALGIVESEIEEFSFSARNELDWLNEHMAGIFDENDVYALSKDDGRNHRSSRSDRNFAETFKTPGKLRGKTPRTVRKANPAETRVPLSDVFNATPDGTKNRLANQQHRMQSPQLQSRVARVSPGPSKMASPRRNVFSPKPGPSTQDSGYYGSQDVAPLNIHADADADGLESQAIDNVVTTTTVPLRESPFRHNIDSPEKTFQTAKEDQTTRALPDSTTNAAWPGRNDIASGRKTAGAPDQKSPAGPEKTSPTGMRNDAEANRLEHQSPGNASPADDARSPSDGSSPIRPLVRKSSLNFASLPAREPLAAGKSVGARASRTSHLDHNKMSYYNRPTGGKSLGNLAFPDVAENDDQDEMDVDEAPHAQAPITAENVALNHNKTYTQRLQDQITKLGNSQTSISRQSKSIPNNPATQQSEHVAQTTPPPPKSPASARKQPVQTTPGAFPEDDDEDDWIEPPAAEPETSDARPALPKSHSADVMEGIHSKDTIGQPDFIPQQGQNEDEEPAEPTPAQEHAQTRPMPGHVKSASVSAVALPSTVSAEGPPLTKAATISGTEQPETPKSPARSFRDSPLKQVKNKLSSILKSSRGLLASSAAISAEGKSSLLSPSTTRLGSHQAPSLESVIPKSSSESQKAEAAERQGSPTRQNGRRARASIEREKEEKRREKEGKRLAERMDKLDKAREKEREKARVFSKEQEKMGTMEKQLASKKEPEKLLPKETPKPTRTSPRKAKEPAEDESKAVDQDVDMADAPPAVQQPSAPRSAGPSQGMRNKEIKRPVRPGKEAQAKPKQAPTVIKVNMGSQHSQYQPATNSQETPVASSSQAQSQLSSKASKASLHTKPSAQSLKSSTSSTGRPKALELAAKKKEQDEREAQRRRDAKAEVERKRAAAQEEQRRQEQQRRQETEKQRQKEREQAAAAEAKKNAQRQAAIEKAKLTRAPPPAVRSQPNGPPDLTLATARPSTATSSKVDGQPARPPSRMASNMHRPQEEAGRPVNAVLSNSTKAGAKRTAPPENNDDSQAKRPPSRGGPTYQAKDAKRRRTSDDAKDEPEAGNPPNIKGPPVRPSGGFKKDLPPKSIFQSGYSNAPPSATRDLFKASITAQQQNGQAKASHPLDMAQISKGTIPFAPNPNAASAAYKTPARPGAFNATKSAAKSAPRSSPRFQNGESIELPEIQTDDEDDDDDEPHGMSVAAWADSPDLRQALMRQEGVDPSQIFGPPAPLNMEEVFSKSKDRWHKFRARTSSANWNGADRLTEEDIRKDLAARDKLRREGAWSYEMGKDML